MAKHKKSKDPAVKRNPAGETIVRGLDGRWYLKTKVKRGVVMIQVNGRWVPYH